MAMMRYAYARVVQPHASPVAWAKGRTAAEKKNPKAKMAPDLLNQAEGILGHPFTPDRYLLTHATIVASVDTEKVPNCKTGRVKIAGQDVNRPWDDYHVTANTERWINNNNDCWSRGVLAKAYTTFIGGVNYQEHVQLPEFAKGRIIDAVLRDVGDSLYVDILVATDRKHKELVADIESGKMSTLSMGCVIDGSQCSKCGNWAPDETTACRCIKYEKGNTFYDEQGKRRIVAELCGHISINPHGGVTFIEASWVGTPAFTGAVMRNVLDPIHVSADLAGRAREILNSPPKKWAVAQAGESVARKVAKVSDRRIAFGEDEEPEAEAAPPAEKDPLDDAVDKTYQEVMERVQRRVDEKLRGTGTEPPPASDAGAVTDTNNNLGKDAQQRRLAALGYRAGLNALVRTASSGAELIDKVARFNADYQVEIPVGLYRAALRVGGTHKHGNVGSYLAACTSVMGRKPVAGEQKTLIRLGHLLAQYVAAATVTSDPLS